MHYFAWVYQDPFHCVFVASTTIISIFSNCLLLYIIYTTTSKHLGTYRLLLAIFAICDLTTSVMHAVLQPIMHLTNSGFYFIPRQAGRILFGVPLDSPLCLLFIATYYQTFLILAYHFVYRYKTVTRFLYKTCTDNWRIRQWIIIGIVIYILYIATFIVITAMEGIPNEYTRAHVPPEILQLYGHNLRDRNIGYTCIAIKRQCSETGMEMCWHFPMIFSVAGLMGLFGATAGVIGYCMYHTSVAIKTTSNFLASKTRRMQRDLFHALLIQTAVPCLVSYTPLSTAIVFPILTGIELGDFGNLLFSITAVFPAIDSFFVLFYIIRFRNAVIQLFRLSFLGATAEESSTDDKESKFGTAHTIPMFSFAYQDPFHTIYVCATTCLSLFSNGLLLYVIFTTAASNLGKYKTLLAIFAVCDMITSIGHAVVQPIMHLTSTGFYGFPRHAGKMMIFGVSLDTTLCLMFIGTFYQTFLILAYHYVYRYKTVTSMLRNSFTDRWKAKHWTVIGIVVYVLFIGTFVTVNILAFIPQEWTRANAPPELLEIYGMDLSNPKAGFESIVAKRRCSNYSDELCWHWPTLAAVIGLMSLFGATAAVIIYCIYQTNHAISSTSNVLTPKTRRMQRSLFYALLIQTAIPMIFSYVPLSCFMLFPIFTGISLGDAGNFLFSITAIFPAIDSFFVLFFIARFRLAVIRLFHLPFDGVGIDGSSTDHTKINTVHTQSNFVNSQYSFT